MRKQIYLGICILILLIPGILAVGSVQTGSLTPSTVNLCGEYGQYVTITASNIFNEEPLALTGVTARLYLSGNTGLSFVTTQDVNLGNVNPLAYSSINPSWTIQCNSPIQGVYTAYINYTTTNGYRGSSSDEAVTVLSVHETSPFVGNITLIQGASQHSEQNYQVVSDSTPTVKVTTTRNAICKGTLDADESYPDMDFIFYGTQKDHNYTFLSPISEGQHSVYIKCKDEFDYIMPSSLILYFIIDTAGPQINLISPVSKVVGDFTQIKVGVNEEAECRFGKEDESFSSLEEFDNVNGSIFTAEITGLEEKTYTYFIKCRDESDNIASKKIIFEAERPPKAEIILEQSSPLTEGTYELRLSSSKTLRETPKLTYTFTDDIAFSREIGLFKEGSYYKGYIIIEESEKTRSGVFNFKGYDLNGNEGAEITKGKVFLVDTIKPNTPESLQGALDDDEVILKWYYDGEKPDHYNIYRSTVQGVGYISFYDESESEEFSDENILSGQLYYYRIAAVDAAGNIGELSNEVSVYTTGGSQQTVITQNTPTKETRDWKTNTEKEIDSVLIDLEWAFNNLQDQATKEKAVEDLGLVKQVMSVKEEISKLKNQLRAIDLLSTSDSEVRDAVSKAEALIARTKRTTPQSLTLEKNTNLVQATTPEDVGEVVKEYLKTGNLTDSQTKKYRTTMEKINSLMKVEVGIKTVTIELLDGTSESRVIVEKKFSYESPDALSNAIIVEMIPKTVAGDMSSIDIKTPDAYVIKEDPIFAWNYPELSFDKNSFIYVLVSGDTSESAKNTKTIALLDPMTVLNLNSNGITGFSVFFSRIVSNGIQAVGLILGILVILALGMYYMVTINEVDIGSYLNKVSMPDFFKGNKPKEIKEIEKQEAKLNIKESKSAKSITPTASVVQITQIAQTVPDIPEAEQVEEKNEKADVPGIIESYEKQRLAENPKPLEPKRQEVSDWVYSYVLKTDDPLRNRSSSYFYAKNGEVIRGISELKDSLKKMDDFTFYYHVSEAKNDFADWVDEVYKNKALAEHIRKSGNRRSLIRMLDKLMQ